MSMWPSRSTWTGWRLGASRRSTTGSCHGGGRAFYSPSTDSITLPPLEAFEDEGAYWATSAHEHGHWTAHESRCGRDLRNRFGDEAYAMEELVAELSAAFTCATLGIATTPRPDHAQYLAHWLTVLKADTKALHTAATRAQAATDFLVAAARGEATTTDGDADEAGTDVEAAA